MYGSLLGAKNKDFILKKECYPITFQVGFLIFLFFVLLYYFDNFEFNGTEMMFGV
jgi:hypothetical protein